MNSSRSRSGVCSPGSSQPSPAIRMAANPVGNGSTAHRAAPRRRRESPGRGAGGTARDAIDHRHSRVPRAHAGRGGRARGGITRCALRLQRPRARRPQAAVRGAGRVESRQAACVVACNRDVAGDIRGAGGRAHLVPHGVDLGRFEVMPQPPGPAMRVLAVGRLVAKKGFEVLIDALATLDDGRRAQSRRRSDRCARG